MSKTIDHARQLIQSRLADLDAEAKRLERALVSLGKGDAPRRRRPGRPRKRPVAATATPSKRRPARKRKSVKRVSNDGTPARKPARPKAKSAKPQRAKSTKRPKAKRTPRGRRRQQLLAAIKANPGARPAELAKAIGVKSTQVHALIAKARAEKLIVKRGQGYALKR